MFLNVRCGLYDHLPTIYVEDYGRLADHDPTALNFPSAALRAYDRSFGLAPRSCTMLTSAEVWIEALTSFPSLH